MHYNTLLTYVTHCNTVWIHLKSVLGKLLWNGNKLLMTYDYVMVMIVVNVRVRIKDDPNPASNYDYTALQAHYIPL